MNPVSMSQSDNGGPSVLSGSPHVARLRHFGRVFEITLMAGGCLVAAVLLFIGVANRMDVHAEDGYHLLYAVIILIGLAAWHRVMPPIGNILLDLCDRRS